ncbi:MAG TPA: HslU--HslV peptidase proteolytic subunit [Myxococcales bacterium]|nr:HslU--HslV peptidase proteolytic subunit [Deltaproteobacteria bacterium]HAA53806.1 HslU--HslV peptidase proteolytic subunit [Myxococcales bacterium]|tara:strand:- start:13114 stop:13647 length:534 start_codon:yes stop_codon:yes gene_type:complete
MFKGTTVVAVRKDGKTVVAGDGQVSMGNTVVKHSARKVRRIHENKVICGFAGSTADAITLQEKFEHKLKEFNGNLARAAVELAKDWRTDKILRKLEALLIAANKDQILVISGNGDVLEPDDDVYAIGSGGPYALAAARALKLHSTLDATSIAQEALKISGEICIYSNTHITFEEIEA